MIDDNRIHNLMTQSGCGGTLTPAVRRFAQECVALGREAERKRWATAARLAVEATPEQLPMALDALADVLRADGDAHTTGPAGVGQVERTVRPVAEVKSARLRWHLPTPDADPVAKFLDNETHLLYDQAALDAEVAAERERCAKLCDLHSRLTWNDDRKAQSRLLAAEIRRGPNVTVEQPATAKEKL